MENVGLTGLNGSLHTSNKTRIETEMRIKNKLSLG